MLTKTEAERRVAKGVAFLDGQWPDWFEHVNVNTLDMSEPCHCVLGQLDGDYCDTAARLFRGSAFQRVRARASGERHWCLVGKALGFDAPDSEFSAEEDADYLLLQSAWVEAIGVRRFPETALTPAESLVAVARGAQSSTDRPRA